MANPTFTGNLPSGNFGYGQLVSLDQSMGLPAGDQPTFNGPGGLVYQVYDAGGNTFGIRQTGQTTAGNQALQLAQQLQQMQVTANQPAIQTLQSQYNPDTGGGALVDRYNALLSSINTQGSVAVNAQTLASTNNLASRGILGGAVKDNSIAQSLLPVTAAYSGLTAQTGLGEQQDLGNIAAQIASLRAGNVQGAITGATNLTQISQNAANIQAQLAEALQQQQIQSNAQVQAARIGQQYQNIAPGNSLINTANNSVIDPAMLLSLLGQAGATFG